MAQSARVQRYIAANAHSIMQTHAVPPFTLYLQSKDKSADANFAMPDHAVEGDASEFLRQIEEICATHECHAQVRFLQPFAPALPTALRAAGYEVAGSWPILLCTAESCRDAEAVAGLEMVTISSESAIAEVKEGLDANALGYDPNAELATDEEAETFRQSLKNSLAFTARLQGQAVGAGMFNPIDEGVTEVVGITTLEPFRRRGIASYLTTFATRAAFALGAEMVFLIPENEQAQRIYERLGYYFLTDLLIYQPSIQLPARYANWSGATQRLYCSRITTRTARPTLPCGPLLSFISGISFTPVLPLVLQLVLPLGQR